MFQCREHNMADISRIKLSKSQANLWRRERLSVTPFLTLIQTQNNCRFPLEWTRSRQFYFPWLYFQTILFIFLYDQFGSKHFKNEHWHWLYKLGQAANIATNKCSQDSSISLSVALYIVRDILLYCNKKTVLSSTNASWKLCCGRSVGSWARLSVYGIVINKTFFFTANSLGT